MQFNHDSSNIIEKNTKNNLFEEFSDKLCQDHVHLENNLYLLIFKEGIRTCYVVSKKENIEKNSIIGFFSLYSIPKNKIKNSTKKHHNNKRVNQIYSIWLDKNYRQQGLGSFLMHFALINSQYPIISSENNGINHVKSWCKLLEQNSYVDLLNENLEKFPYQLKDNHLPIDKRYEQDISKTDSNYYFFWHNCEESKKTSRNLIQKKFSQRHLIKNKESIRIK